MTATAVTATRLATAPPRAPEAMRPEPAVAIERFTGIHIGSVEIEILPSPESATAPADAATATPAPASAGTIALARGLTSPIGLRQS